MTTILNGAIHLTYTIEEFNSLLGNGLTLTKKDTKSLRTMESMDIYQLLGYESTGNTTPTKIQLKLWYKYNNTPMYDTIWVKTH